MAAAAAEIGAALAVHVDVSEPASVDALARRVPETFGAVHVVCNNAGIAPPRASVEVRVFAFYTD
jgi:NAD(P)-dependent dehydrogenase (short-subunit alcohol dehydrogenase family)